MESSLTTYTSLSNFRSSSIIESGMLVIKILVKGKFFFRDKEVTKAFGRAFDIVGPQLIESIKLWTNK